MIKKWIKTYLAKRKEKIKEDNRLHSIHKVGVTDCCGVCLHWELAHPEAWAWGTVEEPDGLGKCWVHGAHKYGGDWCDEFKVKKGEDDGG